MSFFYKPTHYNGCTKQQMWMSIIADSHDIHCNCTEPFCHILDCIFPEGHKDRDLTIEQIISRGKQSCHFGGEEEEDSGIPIGTSAATAADQNIKLEGEDFPELDVEELLTAAKDAEQR